MSLDGDARRDEEEEEGGGEEEEEEEGGDEGGGDEGEDGGGESFLLWSVSEAVTRLIHHKPNGKHEDAINSRASLSLFFSVSEGGGNSSKRKKEGTLARHLGSTILRRRR
ncbi:hypothetical protein HZH66_005531 [Vespula vulgaris]|uniref:Uncharacterized protein n=1 Tax=Vespula vulgaris TaxID=7454 RepID=A0A834K6J5_VESVU|nr:hypothetical protein HZH66_005531 [Vespula vulgaris]